MPTARWDIGPRRVFTEQVEWIARVHVERRRAQGRRDDAKRPLLTVQVCAGGVRSRPTTLPAAPQRTFIRPAEDKMRPGGGEPRYAVSDCCSRIHVSTCPAQFGAPCQGLAPAEASRIPWGFCRYIQLYSLSLDTGNHSTPARARETASAGAWETPASGHAADRGRAGNDGREVTCLSGFFDLPGDVFVRVKLPGITGFCGNAAQGAERPQEPRCRRDYEMGFGPDACAAAWGHPRARR